MIEARVVPALPEQVGLVARGLSLILHTAPEEAVVEEVGLSEALLALAVLEVFTA